MTEGEFLIPIRNVENKGEFIVGRPAPTMIVRLERLKRRIEAMDLSEDEIKQLEREQRALSMQINYRKRIAKQKLPFDKRDENTFTERLNLQNFQCAICTTQVKEQDKSSHWDHCHATGKWRGILCVNCNIGLGNFRDNVDILKEHSKMTRSKILQMVDEIEPVIYKIPDVFEVEPIENDSIKNRKWG